MDFDRMMLPLYAPLQRRLFMITGDSQEAADLTQEAFARAWRAWDHFDGREPRAWLFQIGLRLALNSRRRFSLWSRIKPLLSAAHPAADSMGDPDLWAAVRRLRADERNALLLHAIDGYSYREIGQILDMPPGTVGSLISRAKAKLREALGDQWTTITSTSD